jgi:peptide/nickel transport system substrate-binding protein
MTPMTKFTLTALATALLVAGCGDKPKAPVAGQSGSTGSTSAAALCDPPLIAACEPGIPGGRLVIASLGDPKTFNPITENEQSSSDIIRMLFVSMTTFDWPTQTASPGLAHKWEVAEDKVTWTWHLRKGLKWSDGQPITADDVVFTWNDVIFNPDIINVTKDAFVIEGKKFEVSKVDDLTVRVVTPAPYPPMVEFWGGIPIVPKHVLAGAVAGKNYEAAYGIDTPPAELVCSGPYKLKLFKSGEFTLLERNPHFYIADRKGQRLPYIENIIFTVMPDMNAMSLRFLAGESHVHESVRPDEYARFKEEADRGKFKLHELGIGPEKAFLWFNLNPGQNTKTGRPFVDPRKMKWFQDVRFRRAISHAIDRESIIKSVYSGRARVAFGSVSPTNKKWHNPDVPEYLFDPGKARALLKEMGVTDRNGDGFLEDASGNVIEFVMHTNTGNNTREKTGILIQEDLKRLGIKLIFQPIDFNTLVDKMTTSFDYDCILLGLGGGAMDPIAQMNVYKSSGFTHGWYPQQKKPATEWEARIDQLMDAQAKTLDEVERKRLFNEVQVIMNEQLPQIYTVAPLTFAAIRSDIGNVRPTVLASWRLTWNAEELYFRK